MASSSFLSRFQALPQQPFDDNIFDNNDDEVNPDEEQLRDEETFGASALTTSQNRNSGKRLVYTREFLLSLRDSPRSQKPMPNIPIDIQIGQDDDQAENEDDSGNQNYHSRRGGRARSSSSQRGGSLSQSPNSRFSARSAGLHSADFGNKKKSTAAWFNEKVKPQDNLFFDSNTGLTSDEINRKKAFEEFRKTHSFKAEQQQTTNEKSADMLTEDELLAQQNVVKPNETKSELSKPSGSFNFENMVISKLNNNAVPASSVATKNNQEQPANASAGGRFQKYFKRENGDHVESAPAQPPLSSVVAFDSPPVFNIPTPKLEEEEDIPQKFKSNKQVYLDSIDDKLQPAIISQPAQGNGRSLLDLVQKMKGDSADNNSSNKNAFKDASSLEEELLKSLKTPSSSVASNNSGNTPIVSQASTMTAPVMIVQHPHHHIQHNVHPHLPHPHHQIHHNSAGFVQQQIPFQPPQPHHSIEHQFDMNAFFSRYNAPSVASASSGAPFMDASSIEQQLLHPGFDNNNMPYPHQMLPPNQFPVIPQQAYASPVNQYQQYLYQQQLRSQQQPMQPTPPPIVMNQPQQPVPPILSEQNFPPLSGSKPSSASANNKQQKPTARLIPTQTIKNQGKSIKKV